MKFLADAGISMATVLALRNRRHDAVHLREQRLQRLPDAKVMEKPDFDSRYGHDCYLLRQINALWVLAKTPMYA